MLHSSRQPIRVTYLLAVWGERYIRQFMDLSLRTLLAAGNIPALASETESRFVFLTSVKDRAIFTSHPMFKRLQHACPVEFIDIDDLIFEGNYSATLTMAYERGMRSAGDAMLSTYFIYLVADYIMADGSLANLLPHMQRNVSAITAGNFQVVEESMAPMLATAMDKITGVLSLGARQLVGLSLPHLHPTSAANIVNQNYSHTIHTNRLFWRVDNHTLIGRFYLRHMLAIKPEISDYIIGSSCDYSFVDEMCPSGNVVHLSDSDEYCVVELQPFPHEQQLVAHGPLNQSHLVQSLGEWTTCSHRKNSLTPVIFHSRDIPVEAAPLIAHSLSFIEAIEQKLPATPQPIRSHPYWTSCIDGVLQQVIEPNIIDPPPPDYARYFKNGVFAGIVGSPVFGPPLGASSDDYHLLRKKRYRYGDRQPRLKKIARAFFTNPVKGKIWHRQYAESRMITKTLRDAADASGRLIVIACEPTDYAKWCRQHLKDRVSLQNAALFCKRASQTIRQQSADAAHAVILLPTEHIHQLGAILTQCEACLAGDKKITIIVTQRYFLPGGSSFKDKLASLCTYYDRSNSKIISFTVLSNRMRGWYDPVYRKCKQIILRAPRSPIGIFKRLAAVGILSGVCMGYVLGNLTSRKRRYPKLGRATCAVITLTLGENP